MTALKYSLDDAVGSDAHVESQEKFCASDVLKVERTVAQLAARRLRRRASGSSLGVNTVFELGRVKRYDSATSPAYYLKMLHE